MSIDIKENIKHYNNEIAKYAKDNTVKLLAVSKRFPKEDILFAYENTNQRAFGENRIQELEEKVPALPADIEWHLIGHLQSNKVAKAVQLVQYIHSVESEKLLLKIDKYCKEYSKKIKIFLEVNISGEESKNGLSATCAKELAKCAVLCENIEFVGLMTMAPYGANDDELQQIFSKLRDLKENIETENDIKLPELSMGMSSDYKIAIKEGATYIRIGTGIFGNRVYK